MKKTVELGFFLAVALILSYVESLIPISIGIPGIKLGLPNAVVVLLLYDQDNVAEITETRISAETASMQKEMQSYTCYTVKEAALVNGLRIVLSGFLFSNLYTILYALSGAVFSMIVMLIGKKLNCFSVVGVSVLGGVFHNIGQIIVAMLVVQTFAVSYYVPVLIIAGTLTGALLGVIVMELMPYLRHYRQHI